MSQTCSAGDAPATRSADDAHARKQNSSHAGACAKSLQFIIASARVRGFAILRKFSLSRPFGVVAPSTSAPRVSAIPMSAPVAHARTSDTRFASKPNAHVSVNLVAPTSASPTADVDINNAVGIHATAHVTVSAANRRRIVSTLSLLHPLASRTAATYAHATPVAPTRPSVRRAAAVDDTIDDSVAMPTDDSVASDARTRVDRRRVKE